MKSKLLKMILTSLALSGCVQKITEHVAQPADKAEVVAPADQLDAKDGSKLRAEKLVAAAEPMLSPVAFFYADEILDEALKADPNNRQAQLYKAIIAPYMKFRGFMSRTHDPDTHPGIRQMNVMEDYRFAAGDLFKFLYAPAEPFRTEEDLQKFMAELLVEQVKLIDFVKANKNFLTRIHFPVSYRYKEMIRECSVQKVNKGTYRLQPCPYLSFDDLRMNQADWEALLHSWNGGRIYLMIGTAYDVTGVLNYVKADLDGKFRNDREVFEYIRGIGGNFGKLKPDHRFTEVLGMMSDFYSGYQWILSMQDEACNKEKRKTHMFPSLCLRKDAIAQDDASSIANTMDVLAASLNGGGGLLHFTEPRRGTKTRKIYNEVRVDMMALFKNPAQDASALFPNAFSRCGRTNGYADKTFGGLFPDGNADDMISDPDADNCPPTRPLPARKVQRAR